ncbi:MAG: hypothetical protein SNJ59_16100 [Aggregatilineales bacterium]
MGLELTVGILPATAAANAIDRNAFYYDQFAAINAVLRELGLPEHHEPETLRDNAPPLIITMYGHTGLHTLRRIAAHLWAGLGVPEPARRSAAGVPDATGDPVLERYFDAVRGWMGPESHRCPMAYEHLIVHSEDRGYYLPQRFPQVLLTRASAGIAGTMIGSAPVLLDECRQVLGALGVPPELARDDERVRAAFSLQGRGTGWARYGIEVQTCLNLRDACLAAIEQGAALVFT